MGKPWRLLVPLAAVFLLVATACPNGNDDAAPDDLFDEIMDRGTLECGVNDAVPAFGFLTPEGEYEGFDIDFCRAVAAGVFGDADAVTYTALTAEARFTALQARQVDVLIRNTTWTAGRDGGERAAFTLTTFYDAQDMMVAADSPYQTLEDMDGTTVCVLSGTTTQLNLESQFRGRGIPYDELTFETSDEIREAFIAGRCDGWTSDRSQLAAFRGAWPEDEGGPEALRILEETMSKEPLGPSVLDGSPRWFDAVNWVVIATIQAEEFGITSENVDQIRETSDDPEIQRFLGVEVEGATFDPGLGLPTDFAYQVVSQVGNYAEIYDRHVGEQGLGLDRGVNSLWTEGGLLYAPPYR